ncbi:MAG: hypothetical protein H0T73_13520 [Ardenticatenales bacterium]|nr:hypothetical protein [Ardenticatenales bacterium]
MGAWGVESHANDTVWDALETEAEAMDEMSQAEADATLHAAFAGKDTNVQLGVVLWLLEERSALVMPRPYVETALGHATRLHNDQTYLAGWRDPAARQTALAFERQLLEAVLAGTERPQREVRGLLEKLFERLEGDGDAP